MERLRSADIRAALEFYREIYQLADLESFKLRLLKALPSVVPCDAAMYFETNVRLKRTIGVADPPVAAEDLFKVYGRYVHESPTLKAYTRGKGLAVKFSDFVTQREFQRTGLYNEFFRPLRIQHRMTKGLPGSPGLVTAFSLERGTGTSDFGERDRLLLTMLGPHINQALRNATAVTRIRTQLARLAHSAETVQNGMILLDPARKAPTLTPRARTLADRYFGGSRKGGAHLPEALERWLAFQERSPAGEIPLPQAPLVVDREATRLVVRLVNQESQRLLMLSVQALSPEGAVLEGLGLSPREAEVLTWVAQGKTNVEIGMILGVSRRTIDKHLERILVKLGVETRTAAAARALELSSSA